ncbi:MAG: hypothetical protein IKW76_08855 [Clostridia bacterium]|nr:hypothetical protein [Clostridia bacterium]
MELVIGMSAVFYDSELGFCRTVTLISEWLSGIGKGFNADNVRVPVELCPWLGIGDVVVLSYEDEKVCAVDILGANHDLFEKFYL